MPASLRQQGDSYGSFQQDRAECIVLHLNTDGHVHDTTLALALLQKGPAVSRI